MLVFMVGTGRSGSSFLHEVLVRHPEAGFVSNIDDRLPALNLLGRWNNQLHRHLPPSLTTKGRVRFAPSEGYRLLAHRVSPVLGRSPRDLTAGDVTPWLAERLSRFFTERIEAQASTSFIHKLTGWPRVGFMHHAFPDARFIHIVRDGRAVANSFLQMPWWSEYQGPPGWRWGPLPAPYHAEWERSGRSFVVLAGITWKLLIDASSAAQAAVPASQWMEVRYEDVLADPRPHVERMVRFTGLEWDDRFEAEFAKHTWRTGRREAFRRDIDPDNLAALESSLADHLRRYGYETKTTAADNPAK